MLNEGTTALPYEPYFEGLRNAAVTELVSEGADNTVIDTLPIPEELRTFLADKGYGRGVEGYPNYIDFDRKVFRQNSGTYIASGTETAQARGQNAAGNYVYSVSSMFEYLYVAQTPMLCDKYTYKGKAGGASAVLSFTDSAESYYVYYNANSKNFYCYFVSSASTVEEFLAELKGTRIDYALAEPIEIDISAYLGNDNFIEVEGGGTITMVNEYEYDIPSTINYITKVGT
jgi:hypothetical protein